MLPRPGDQVVPPESAPQRLMRLGVPEQRLIRADDGAGAGFVRRDEEALSARVYGPAMTVAARTSALALVLVVLTGCGSTAAGQQGLTTGTSAGADSGLALPDGTTSGGDGLSLPAAPTGTGTGTGPSSNDFSAGSGGSQTSAGPDNGGAATATGNGTAAGPTSSGPAAGRNGPGVKADEVRVGFAYVSDAAAANRALGADVGSADAKGAFDAVAADINATGGIAGRKLVPVYAPYEANSAEPYDTIYQRLCTRMTQDDEVFAAIAAIPSETFRGCLQEAGVVHLSDGISRSDQAVLARYPYTFEIGSVRTDRVATAQLAALQAGSWFTRWDTTRGAPGAAPVKVGVVSSDAPSIARAVDGVLVPGLRRLGHDPVVVKIAAPQSTSQSGDAVAAIQAAALKMRSDGVTHVVPFDSNGSLTLFFTRNAESQGYRPRYGVNTGNGLQVLLDAGSISVEQLNGAVGLGTGPMIDLRPADNPDDGPYANAARTKCLDVMRRAGVAVEGTNAKGGVLALCAAAYFLRDRAGDAVTGGAPLNRDTLRAAVERSGSAFLHGDTGRTLFGPQQHDGGADGSLWSFVPSCTCMRYSGAARPL